MELKEYLIKNDVNFSGPEDNLSVGGYLDLEGTDITSLPDNLSVGGSLYLRGTGITSLPDNLSVVFVGAYDVNFIVGDDSLTIGCTKQKLKNWLESYKDIAVKHNLSDGSLYAIKEIVIDCIKMGWIGSLSMLEELQ